MRAYRQIRSARVISTAACPSVTGTSVPAVSPTYGGRVVGTTLRHSDYAGMARALGLHGERVEKPEDLRAALERALKNAPSLVDVVTSQTVLSSDAQKGLGFVPDYQGLTAWDEAERRRHQG